MQQNKIPLEDKTISKKISNKQSTYFGLIFTKFLPRERCLIDLFLATELTILAKSTSNPMGKKKKRTE